MRPIVFLDIDDVLAIGDVWTSSYVIRSFRPGGLPFLEEEWEALFAHDARRHLTRLHDQFFPQYVVSSSWSNYLSLENMQVVFEKTDLGFVASELHRDWTTPKGHAPDRYAEISGWLIDHPDVTNFVVLDDANSGHSLHGSKLHARTVFCTSNLGFDDEKRTEAERILLSS